MNQLIVLNIKGFDEIKSIEKIYNVGDIFEIGDVKLQVVKGVVCLGCYFLNKKHSCNIEDMKCFGNNKRRFGVKYIEIKEE